MTTSGLPVTLVGWQSFPPFSLWLFACVCLCVFYSDRKRVWVTLLLCVTNGPSLSISPSVSCHLCTLSLLITCFSPPLALHPLDALLPHFTNPPPPVRPSVRLLRRGSQSNIRLYSAWWFFGESARLLRKTKGALLCFSGDIRQCQ